MLELPELSEKDTKPPRGANEVWWPGDTDMHAGRHGILAPRQVTRTRLTRGPGFEAGKLHGQRVKLSGKK